jgi:regulator of cell morphogenesis and NO signaling
METRMTVIDRSATVAQIVTEHAVAARVFQKHRIDYCCRGNVTVPEACQEKHLDPEALFGELEAALPGEGAGPQDDPRTLSTAALVARIVDRHHGYLRRALPYLAPLSAKVARVHGPHDPRLEGVDQALRELTASLLPHLDDEEEVLFPALMARRPDPAVIRVEAERMQQDHLAVGALLGRMRELAADFTVPEWGCNSYRVLMAELEALEADVLRHVHLENHVLVPRFTDALARAS